MAAVNSLLFLLTTLAPLTERPDDVEVWQRNALHDEMNQDYTDWSDVNQNVITNIQSHIFCPPHSVFRKCGTACPKNCSNYDQTHRECVEHCVADCFCKSPRIKGPDGSCILPNQCPPRQQNEEAFPGKVNAFPFPYFCQENAEFSLVAPFCLDTCDNFRNSERTCSFIKYPGCRCKSGYLLQRDGICIKRNQCQKQEPIDCSVNEQFEECGSYCEADCINYSSFDRSHCRDQRCKRACFCKPGYVRDSNWQCVVPQDCASPREGYFRK